MFNWNKRIILGCIALSLALFACSSDDADTVAPLATQNTESGDNSAKTGEVFDLNSVHVNGHAFILSRMDRGSENVYHHFELASKVNEPLTGRKREFKLYPLTFSEMAEHSSLIEELRLIPHRLVYGYYPEVVANPGQEANILKELTDSYLYRDILTLDKVAKSDKLVLLLKALAMQIGSQVSYNELSGLVGIDAKTIERYIAVLEQSYIIFRLGSFSRNLRNELKFSKKIYFWDMGIRNAVIGNFSLAETRSDIGAMWENFAIAERMKQINYHHPFAQAYFWRTKQQTEIDYIEEQDGSLRAFEFKWNERKSPRCPLAFSNTYPDASFSVITPSNIDDFLRL
jgi:predicted AAA+ superfamily ATPase